MSMQGGWRGSSWMLSLQGQLLFVTMALSLWGCGSSTYKCTIVNTATTAVSIVDLDVCGHRRRIAGVPPGGAATVPIDVRCSGDYRVRVLWASGDELVDTVGYVTPEFV